MKSFHRLRMIHQKPNLPNEFLPVLAPALEACSRSISLNKFFVLKNAKTSFIFTLDIFRKAKFSQGQLTSPKSSFCHFLDVNKAFLNLMRLNTATFSFKLLEESRKHSKKASVMEFFLWDVDCETSNFTKYSWSIVKTFIKIFLWLKSNRYAILESAFSFWLPYLHKDLTWLSIEAVVRRCSVKNVFLEISRNSQKNTCAKDSFLLKNY